MRIPTYSVLYTDDFEPITVLQLSPWARTYLERHRRIRLPVIEEVTFSVRVDPPIMANLRTVDIWVESIIRKGVEQTLLFTYNDENALLLRSAFLPGQQRKVRDERAEAFAKGFLKAITSYTGN